MEEKEHITIYTPKTKMIERTARREKAIRCVCNDLLEGGVSSVIVQKLMEDEYGIDYRYKKQSAYDVITEARKRLKNDYEDALPHLKEQLFNTLMDIITESKQGMNHFITLQAIDRVAKLCGAYEDKIKVEAKVDSTVTIDFGIDETEISD